MLFSPQSNTESANTPQIASAILLENLHITRNAQKADTFPPAEVLSLSILPDSPGEEGETHRNVRKITPEERIMRKFKSREAKIREISTECSVWLATCLEAQQRCFSYRAILVAIVSQNYLVFVFCGVSHNCRAICCNMGYCTDVPV